MKQRQVNVTVTDHAVIRYLEAQHGIDLEPLRAEMAGLATTAAQLKASSIAVGRVRMVLIDGEATDEGQKVSLVTCKQRGGLRFGGAKHD
jgi:hypothetical protein